MSSELEQVPEPSRRIYELTALYEISRILLASPTPEQLAFDALTASMGLTGSQWGIMWRAGAPPGTLHHLRSCGRPAPAESLFTLPPEWVDLLTDRQQPVILADGPERAGTGVAARGREPPASLAGIGAEMLLPLSERGSFLGLMALGPNPLGRAPDPFLSDLLASVAQLIAIALGRQSRTPEAALEQVPPTIQAWRRQYPILGEIVGESQSVLDLYEHLTTVAASSCTVLLEGETGCGKELAARVLHGLSPRHDGPFIEVDCGAIPENLIESELFGHEKGAFTGAASSRRGVFALADGGTLFLDEVANLPLKTQNRLLRVLQERRFRPVGGEESLDVDVRVVAASNRSLREAVREGTFREDLFYRLYVYPIRIPPLRDRRDDIPGLIAFYLEKCARDNDLPVPLLPEEFVEHLVQHDFPGNVRELRHLVERSLLRSTGREYLSLEALEEALSRTPAAAPDPTEIVPDEEIPEPVPAVETEPETVSGPDGTVEWPGRAGVERGVWVVDELRRQRFNVKATAERLTALAHARPDNPPPLTDRSSLTYYFQVECFRHYLEQGGNLNQAANAIVGDAIRFTDTVRRRMAGYLDSAALVLADCNSETEAREVLRSKFLKLPEDYLTVLDRLAEHLWALKDT